MHRIFIPSDTNSAVGLDLVDGTRPVGTMIDGSLLLRKYPLPLGVYRLVSSRLLVCLLECTRDRLHGRGPPPDPRVVEYWSSSRRILGENLLLGIGPDCLPVRDVISTPWDIGIGWRVDMWESLGGGDGSEVVGLLDCSLQPIVGADWGPEPPDDDGDEPEPKRADTLTALIDVTAEVRERVDDGEDEGDDDPGDGCGCSDSPVLGMFESVDDTFPPIVVLVEDYEGCEETVTCGETEWNLLKIDEGLGSVPVVGIGDGGETIVGPSSVNSGEGEGE